MLIKFSIIFLLKMIKGKTKIDSNCYNIMFKTVILNNKYMVYRLVQAILDYQKFILMLWIKNSILKIINYH